MATATIRAAVMACAAVWTTATASGMGLAGRLSRLTGWLELRVTAAGEKRSSKDLREPEAETLSMELMWVDLLLWTSLMQLCCKQSTMAREFTGKTEISFHLNGTRDVRSVWKLRKVPQVRFDSWTAACLVG